MSGAHRQPRKTLEELIPPSALLYLHHFHRTPGGGLWLRGQLSAAIINDEAYAREVMHAYAMTDNSVTAPWASRSGIMVRSETTTDYGPLLQSLRREYKTNKAANVLFLNIRLDALSCMLARPVEPQPTLFYRCAKALQLYSDQCTFTQTHDFFLHLIMHLHLPATATVLRQGAPYRALATMLGDRANDIIRPYIDTPLSEQIDKGDSAKDDVVLFCIMVTLIAEIEQKPALKTLHNGDLLNRSAVPTPFVLVDFAIMAVGTTDAYGFVVGDTLYVGNGFGVAATIGAWIEACRSSLPSVYEVASKGTPSATNPLAKYTP